MTPIPTMDLGDDEPTPRTDAEDPAMQQAEREAQEAAQRAATAHPADVEYQPPAPRPAPRQRRSLEATPPSREPPHSAEAEEHVIACCLLDNGETLGRAVAAGIKEESFYFPANRLLFTTCQDLAKRGMPVELSTLAEELTTRRQLEAVGGYPYLMQVTGKIPTTAHAGYFIEKVREKAVLREAIKTATGIVERAYSFTGGLDEFLSEAQFRMERIAKPVAAPATHRTPLSFSIPPNNDRSILLGNRYLNRGDGMVVSSSSGTGKSSMSHQMASDWALARPFFGIQPNGALKILIVQSEDSDGDIAEVWQSLKHVRQYTPEQVAQLEANIRIISERSLRGVKFLNWLKSEVEAFGPDIVILNPLQAYIDGDVTDSKDLGFFLREGLNGMNKDSAFGWIIVHHTTKPATGKDRAERLWHEVMYDMAGGAEIINWARGIISLRALEEPGKFRAVLAKRGRRAGVTREVEQGVGTRLEIVTEIGLQHASGFLPGTNTGIICWEPCNLPDKAAPASKSSGRPEKHKFTDFKSVFPKKASPGATFNEILRLCMTEAGGIQKGSLQSVLNRWAEQDHIEIIRPESGPTRYRAVL